MSFKMQIARILLFVYIFNHVYLHYDEVVSSLYFFFLICVCFIFMVEISLSSTSSKVSSCTLTVLGIVAFFFIFSIFNFSLWFASKDILTAKVREENRSVRDHSQLQSRIGNKIHRMLYTWDSIMTKMS